MSNHFAKASAIMEAIELHCAENFVSLDITTSLEKTIGSDLFVDFTSLSLVEEINLDLSTELEWTSASSLVDNRELLVPKSLVSRDATIANSRNAVFFSSSNGLASGNNEAEVHLHGMCEVVERDQLSHWYLRQAQGFKSGRIDAETISDDVCADLVESIRASGLSIAIWYSSFDTTIPCFVCTIWDDVGHNLYPQRASGSGCHPYKEIAFSRAVTEAAQSRLTHISGARDDMYWDRYRNILPSGSQKNDVYLEKIKLEQPSLTFDDIDTYRADQPLNWTREKILELEYIEDILITHVPTGDVNLDIEVGQIIVPNAEFSIQKGGFLPGPRISRLMI